MRRSNSWRYVWMAAGTLVQGRLFGRLLINHFWITSGLLVTLLFVAALSDLSGHNSLLFGLAIVVAGLPLSLFLVSVKILAQTTAKLAQRGLELRSTAAFLAVGKVQYLFTKSLRDLSAETYNSWVAQAVRVACVIDAAPPKTTKHIATVSGQQFAKLTNSQILALLDSGATLFYQLSAEQKLHLVLVAQTAGSVAFIGSSHLDAPAMEQAEVSISADADQSMATITMSTDSKQLQKLLRQSRRIVETLNTVTRSTLVIAVTETLVVGLGLIGLLWQHVPPAIGIRQLLAINLLAVSLPLIRLKDDHNRLKFRVAIERLDAYAVGGLIGFGSIIGLLSYLNYLYFYVRINLSPNYLDPSLTLYHRALTVTYVTIITCCFVHILFERSTSKPKFWTSYLTQNTKLVTAFGIALLIALTIMYVPWLQSLTGSASLNFTDWLTALGCALFYGLFRLTQRHTRQHTRKAILRDHHPEHLRRHLSV